MAKSQISLDRGEDESQKKIFEATSRTYGRRAEHHHHEQTRTAGPTTQRPLLTSPATLSPLPPTNYGSLVLVRPTNKRMQYQTLTIHANSSPLL